ncbi:deoxyribonuclease-2-alpha-like [Saccostrea echinata]|uniref:deoxyribonuclease-2-alpha-like n=1 Tax=Saccostrea echinata TaxID=191078 RepID=UPI002A82FB47|nr:deoxyribonuclease-2-alpha-like [Saccostrea echinata]
MLAIISGLGGWCSCSITCKSPSNEIVDWFIVYKVPTLSGNFNTEGSEYFYMDSLQTSPNFSDCNRDIQSTKTNPVYKTLLPLYSKSKTLQNYGMYNDQPPNKDVGQSYGHSKGTYAFGKDSGFWIISSVPRFPAAVPESIMESVSDSYIYKDSQTVKGQIIFCVTLGPKYMETLGTAFATTNPYIYSQNGGVPLKGELTTYSMPIKTKGNEELKLLAKSSSFGKDLYLDLIRKELNDSLYVQTWQPSLPSKDSVTNVQNVCFENGLTYGTSLDHSKWAVAKKEPWTCIGDINRSETQYKRGGLALCLYNAKVANEFRKLVLEENRCKEKKQRKSKSKTCRNSVSKNIKKIKKAKTNRRKNDKNKYLYRKQLPISMGKKIQK